jgi:hypothetical protein
MLDGMKAEKFYGCADGPDALITHDSEGKPLVGEELIGWECWGVQPAVRRSAGRGVVLR